MILRIPTMTMIPVTSELLTAGATALVWPPSMEASNGLSMWMPWAETVGTSHAFDQISLIKLLGSTNTPTKHLCTFRVLKFHCAGAALYFIPSHETCAKKCNVQNSAGPQTYFPSSCNHAAFWRGFTVGKMNWEIHTLAQAKTKNSSCIHRSVPWVPWSWWASQQVRYGYGSSTTHHSSTMVEVNSPTCSQTGLSTF